MKYNCNFIITNLKLCASTCQCSTYAAAWQSHVSYLLYSLICCFAFACTLCSNSQSDCLLKFTPVTTYCTHRYNRLISRSPYDCFVRINSHVSSQRKKIDARTNTRICSNKSATVFVPQFSQLSPKHFSFTLYFSFTRALSVSLLFNRATTTTLSVLCVFHSFLASQEDSHANYIKLQHVANIEYFKPKKLNPKERAVTNRFFFLALFRRNRVLSIAIVNRAKSRRKKIRSLIQTAIASSFALFIQQPNENAAHCTLETKTEKEKQRQREQTKERGSDIWETNGRKKLMNITWIEKFSRYRIEWRKRKNVGNKRLHGFTVNRHPVLIV